MAKKIIEQGVRLYSGRCGECGARFTYEHEDVHHNFVRGGEWVTCPCCGHSLRHCGVNGTRW